jgi:4'-phosphopantetheinyl transferase
VNAAAPFAAGCPEPVDVPLSKDCLLTLAAVPLRAVGGVDGTRRSVLCEELLTPAELAISQMHRVPVRQRAHLAGRMAAKIAIARHMSVRYMSRGGRALPFQEFGITQVVFGPEQGRPLVQLPEGWSPLDLSISHSHELAMAAVVCQGRIGMDIERVAPKSVAFQREVFSEHELQWLAARARAHGRQEEDFLCLGWCLKEALVKCTGDGLRAALQQVSFDGWTEESGAEVVSFPVPELGAVHEGRPLTLRVQGHARAAPVQAILSLWRGYALALVHRPSSWEGDGFRWGRVGP